VVPDWARESADDKAPPEVTPATDEESGASIGVPVEDAPAWLTGNAESPPVVESEYAPSRNKPGDPQRCFSLFSPNLTVGNR